MELSDNCATLQRLIWDLHRLDAAYKTYGDAYRNFDSKWDDQLFSVIYTSFGSNPAPSATPLKPGLKQKFLLALEKRYCRRNHQHTVDLLEKILDDAVAKYGEDKIATLFEQQWDVGYNGPEIVSSLQQAGITFAKPDRLNNLLVKAYKSVALKKQQAASLSPKI